MRRWLATLLLAASCLAGAPPGSSAVADDVPAPTDDPFYRVTERVRGIPNGRVLDSRRIVARTSGLIVRARAWQVKYKTTDANGRPTATIATVLVPNAPWEGPGRRPLVSYQVAEDGVGLRCAPSYALRGGLAAGVTPASVDLSFGIPQMIRRGWAVVVADWEGPRSLFAVSAMAGHAVLDGIRAARRFRPAGLGGRRPIAMWGYSGGGFATTAAAQMQSRYAPGLRLRAVAVGGVPGDTREVFDLASGSLLGGASLLIFIGIDRAFPGARLSDYADAALRRDMWASREDCLQDAALRHPLLDVIRHLAPRGERRFDRLMLANSPLAVRGAPTVPTFMYHARTDEVVPFATAQELAQRFCRAGVRLQFRVEPLADHFAEAVLGGLRALAYLGNRFAGRRAPTTC